MMHESKTRVDEEEQKKGTKVCDTSVPISYGKCFHYVLQIHTIKSNE